MTAVGTPVRVPRRVLSPLLLCLVVLGPLCGCVEAPSPIPSGPSSPEPLISRTVQPSPFLIAVADTDAAVNALAMSAALFDRAELVLTAPASQADAQLLAGSAAVALGVPLLLTPVSGKSAALDQELTRLGASTVLSIGGDDTQEQPARADARTQLWVPATAAAVNAVLPGPLRSSRVASTAGLARLTSLSSDSDTLLTQAPAASAAPTGAPGSTRNRVATTEPLPRVTRPQGLTGVLVLATDAPAQLAGVATARAAGAAVVLVPVDQPNPQASAAVVTELGASAATAVIALGEPFAAEASLDWKVRAALTGAQLPGGGQSLFPGRMLVALYGTPGAPVLGVLGEQGLPEAIVRAQQTAAAYAPLTTRTVVPMHEIIATVAAADAGSDGNFSNEISAETLRPWVEAAGAAGQYVVLDLQPGRSDFLRQAVQYQSLLELPHVGLALDPEWRLGPSQRHLAQIGSVDAAEINAVVSWLATLTSERALPQKLLVLHQFRSSMIGNRALLDLSHPEIELLIHVDGLGSQPDKQATWAALHVDAPAGVSWGWKNFYDEDIPTLSPEQTMTEVMPAPDLVTYQ